MKQDQLVSAIRSSFLFSAAGPENLSRLARSSRVTRYSSGQMLFASGEAADGLRVILSGLVRIWISDEYGKELTLSLLEPGASCGEIALLDGLPRTANATQLEDGESLFLPKENVDAILAQDPAFGHHIVQLLCEILRRNTDVLGGFAFRGLDARLSQAIFDLAMAHGVEGPEGLRLQRKFSQTELGQMLGVTREAVNKRLMSLVYDKLLLLVSGHIVITDLDGLKDRGTGGNSL